MAAAGAWPAAQRPTSPDGAANGGHEHGWHPARIRTGVTEPGPFAHRARSALPRTQAPPWLRGAADNAVVDGPAATGTDAVDEEVLPVVERRTGGVERVPVEQIHGRPPHQVSAVV